MAEPLWINADAGAPSYDANELRQAMALALSYGGRLLGARQGVRPGGDQLKVSLAGSTITVKAGMACVDPALSTPQGPYWVAIPADETHSLTAADPTNPRKDILILRVYDDDEDTSGLRLARTEYLEGTPDPSPDEPTVPAGAFRLATIDVPASGGGSPAVTDRRPYTVAAGGVLPVADDTERDALSPFDGLAVWNRTSEAIEAYGATSGAWLPHRAVVDVQTFTAPGTWNKPAGARRLWIRMVAGGGGSGGAAATSSGEAADAAGGAGGTYIEKWLNASAAGASESVTVGSGGAAGAAGQNDGGQGGTSSFGSICSAAGGNGGNGSGATSGSAILAGGTADGTVTGSPDLVIPGGDGMFGVVVSGTSLRQGFGGTSHLGGPQRPSASGSANGTSGHDYGAGGSGAHNGSSSSAKSGGAGGPGIVIVTTFC